MARGMIGPQRGLTVGVDRRSDRAERLEALADVAAVLGTRRREVDERAVRAELRAANHAVVAIAAGRRARA